MTRSGRDAEGEINNFKRKIGDMEKVVKDSVKANAARDTNIDKLTVNSSLIIAPDVFLVVSPLLSWFPSP